MVKTAIFQAAAVILTVLSLSNAYALEGKVVDIRIEGNLRVDSETIKSYLATKVGDRYFPEKVRQDIKNIYAQGFFRDVRVEGEQAPEGVVLTYIVVERPIITKVEFTGNKVADDDEIKEVITVKEHQVFDENKVKDTEKAIIALYEKKGHYLADVRTEITPDGVGKVKIKFVIAEHAKVRIRKVTFLGNEAFESSELLKAVATRPLNAFSFLGKSGNFIDEEFENDNYRLTYFYLDNGYIDIQIDPPQVFLSPDKAEITVVYHLVEGPQYFAGKIDVDGDLIRDKKEILDLLSLKEGDVYSYGKLRRDVQRITDLYADEGYADANVVPRPKVHKEERKVDLTYYIQKGLKIYIERIDITGNNKTRDMVIRRQLKMVEGDLYSATAIKQSELNVNRLGFFKSVKIVPSPGSKPELRKLTVIVEESPTGSISAGAGFSTTEDFMFNAQISQKNLFGRGQSLGATLYYGKNTQSISLSFVDPFVFDTRFSFQTTLNWLYRTYIDFNRRDAGASISVGRLLPRSDFTRLYLSYMWEQTTLSNFPAVQTILNRVPMDSTTSSMTLSFRRNTTNNYLDPTDGSILAASVQYAGRFLGGDNDFNKYEMSYNVYQPLFLNTYLAFRAKLGILDHNQGDRLLITERYFLGGINDLRGFNVRSIGPRYPSDDPRYSYVIIGGNKEVVLSLDYVIPIVKQMGVKGVLFVDAGNAFNDNEPIDPSDFRSDWGFGIRWMSPMGPLRFELGFPIDRRHGEDAQVFQFAIGAPFQ